jgi:hypothetical protein
MVPGSFFANWMNKYAASYKTYTEAIGKVYEDKVD